MKMTKFILCAIIVSAVLCMNSCTYGKISSKAALILACNAQNDLFVTLQTNDIPVVRVDTAAQAVEQAEPGTGVLLLADEYPKNTLTLSDDIFRLAAEKKLRLYVEYPSSLPGLTIEKPRRVDRERVVAASDVFGKMLPQYRILAIHDCHFVMAQAPSADLVAAKVTGLDRAVYGFDGVPTYPVLFVHPDGNMMVSTTKLSQFVTARYTPQDGIQAIWRYILSWLAPQADIPALKWTPVVRPTFREAEKLPDDAARQAIIRGIDWHTNAKMLVHPSWQSKYDEYRQEEIVVNLVGPLIDPAWPAGDGSCGVLEGIRSQINYDGSQMVRWWLRSDSNGETPLAFALRSKLDGDERSRLIAGNLLDWLFSNSGLYINDPKKPSYGLIRWATDSGSLYGDNDIKIILGTLGTAALLNTDRWDENILRNILANYRTTGTLGFRRRSIGQSRLDKNGWETYYKESYECLAPHYEAWIWASYLWLYDKTHYEPLLTRTRSAIERMMETYPDEWEWTNGIQQERGRMLLTLAWLIRVEDRPEYRLWLRRIAEDMAKCQAPCGAIREELGNLDKGRYRPPRSNEDYGKHEAPLIQANGDPIADLLYTCNFTFFGLHEAYATTGEKLYRDMADRLAEFLIRVQVSSSAHPELDGGWFRAFDYERWDYWGSNADSGWGAWSIEVGWTQGWIPTTLTLRELNLNLWDLTKNSHIARHWNKVYKEMLPPEQKISEK